MPVPLCDTQVHIASLQGVWLGIIKERNDTCWGSMDQKTIQYINQK